MITFIGLGAGDIDLMSRGAEQELRAASAGVSAGTHALFVRTASHPAAESLDRLGITFETFDGLYESAPDFASLYTAIAERLLSAARTTGSDGSPLRVGYAVPGHPLIGEESVRLTRSLAHEAGISTRVVSSGSFVEAVLTAVDADCASGWDVRDALTLPLEDAVDAAGNPEAPPPDPSRPLLLFQVFDGASASHAKLALMRVFPDDWTVSLVRWAGVPGREEVRAIPLYRLDREPVDHLTSVYVPSLPPALRKPQFGALVGIMARLRAPGGCPWDREQTHDTLKRYMVEETYEVLEAIDAGDMDLLCEELGDAMLQVVFHAQLAREEGLFTIDDVSTKIVEKLVRRHPHVFGAVEVSGSDEVLRNWEAIKRTEKPQPAATASALDGVPRGLPALMQAMEISKRAVKVGFEWPDLQGVIDKLDEEVAELKATLASASADRQAVASELGDLLFTAVQIARWNKLDPEEALRDMLSRFSRRFRHMEQHAAAHGATLSELTPQQLDDLWNAAKAATAVTSPVSTRG